jgi:hypothetical protein
LSETKQVRGRGRPKGTGRFDGRRLTIRLPEDLATRLMDRARGRVDFQSNRTDRTHAGSDPTGMVSDIVREAVQHYLDGCDREFQEPPAAKASTAKRTRTPAKAAKG